MKKIFFSLLAIAAIASCAKTEAVYTEGDNEIKLSPVTKLQTKANVLGAVDGIVYPTDENFDVFAYWKKDDNSMFTDGDLFLKSLADNGGAEFTNRGNYWGGVVKYYWPKNGYLRFAAYSPADLTVEHQQEGDVYSIKPYVQRDKTAETWDFLVAKTSPAYSMMTAAENVAVEFEHALSWITLKVRAKDADAAQAFDIKKVTIKDIFTVADFEATMVNGMPQDPTKSDYPWTNWMAAKDYVVFEGSQMATETLTEIENTTAGTVIIPQATTRVVVEFDQYGVNGTADTPGMSVELDLVLDTDDTPWVPGKHYIYNLIFGLDEILINPSVVDWDDVEVGELETDAVNVSTAAQLKAALANDAVTKIVFQKDIAGNFTVNEVAGRSLTIDGNGYKLTGSFFMNGKTTYANAATVYENINFETADASTMIGEAFIYCGEGQGTNFRYPDGMIIKNCTFAATGAAEKAAVAVKLWALNGKLAVEDCTATGLHSFMQLTSCGEATVAVENLTVSNCKNGISLGNTGKATILKSNITADEYGIRANGSVADTQIEETTIAAKQPIIVRKVTTDGYVLTVDKTTLTPATADDYQIIFTKADDSDPYEAPTAAFTLNAATTYKVFPTPEGWVTNAEELAAALTADQKNISVVLTADIELPISSLGQMTGGSGEYKLGSENTQTITIDLNGKNLKIGTTYWSSLGAKNDNVLFTIKNGTMTSEQATGTWNSYDLTFANCNYKIENVKFAKAIAFTNATKHVSLKNVTITETHDYYAMWISAKGQNIVIDGLTVESAGRGIKIDEEYVNPASLVNLKVKNSTFKTAKKAAILVKSVAGANITLENVNIADVAADQEFAVWVDEDAAAYADKVVVNGGVCKVEGANVTAADTDTELREALKNGNDVILTSDIATTDAESNGYGATGININGGVFDGNGHTIEVEGATSTWDSAIAIKGGTIKNLTVTKGFRGIFFKNGTEKIVLENVIIDGPTYTISCDSAGNQGFEAYNSKFYGWTSYAGTIGTGYFKGCTFGAGAGYNFSRPYAPTTYVNCTFEAGHKIDARAKVSFENCTLDGVALTSDNINTLVTGNRQNIESVK